MLQTLLKKTAGFSGVNRRALLLPAISVGAGFWDLTLKRVISINGTYVCPRQGAALSAVAVVLSGALLGRQQAGAL